MTRTIDKFPGLILLAAGLVLLQPAGEAAAQSPDGFLFGKPSVTFSFNMGYGVPRAESDFFQDIDTLFTLGKGDFRAPVFGGTLAMHLNERMDLTLGFSYQRSETWSEYRDFVEELEDGSRLPIEQETRLTQVPLTASLRYFFLERGREISRFAWVPNTWAPYVGFGGGRIWYKFEQRGDFVDFVDYSIFTDYPSSEGWGWTAHVLGGVQYSLSPRFVLTVEGRYSLAGADLDGDTYGTMYDPIDLAGFRGNVGIGVRF